MFWNRRRRAADAAEGARIVRWRARRAAEAVNRDGQESGFRRPARTEAKAEDKAQR